MSVEQTVISFVRFFSGKQIFEKMISGMYMGELIRQVLVDLMRDDLIFFNCNREKILERGAFYTRYNFTVFPGRAYRVCHGFRLTKSDYYF